MKKILLNKLIALTVATICVCFSGASAFAASPENDVSIISPQNIAVTSAERSLDIITSNQLACYGKTNVQLGYTAKVFVELQQATGTWETIKTWSASGGTSASVYQEPTVATGESYRLRVTYAAYTSSGALVESFVKFTTSVDC